MNHSRFATSLTLALVATLVAACGVLPGDRKFWYPQAAGGPVAREEPQAQAQAPTQPQAAQPRGRQLEVAPELIAQSAPRPNPAPATAGAPRVDDATLGASYTQATRYGDLLFVSGQIGMDLRSNAFNGAASVEQQTRQAMDNIRQILEAHRLTMANIVSVTVYLRSMGDFRAMNNAYESYFRTTLPSRSVVEVQRLPRDAAVEISVIAGR